VRPSAGLPADRRIRLTCQPVRWPGPVPPDDLAPDSPEESSVRSAPGRPQGRPSDPPPWASSRRPRGLPPGRAGPRFGLVLADRSLSAAAGLDRPLAGAGTRPRPGSPGQGPLSSGERLRCTGCWLLWFFAVLACRGGADGGSPLKGGIPPLAGRTPQRGEGWGTTGRRRSQQGLRPLTPSRRSPARASAASSSDDTRKAAPSRPCSSAPRRQAQPPEGARCPGRVTGVARRSGPGQPRGQPGPARPSPTPGPAV
jgi:hypothetical protein